MNNQFNNINDEELGKLMVSIQQETITEMEFIIKNIPNMSNSDAFQMAMYKRLALIQFRLEYLFQITTPLSSIKENN